MPTTKVCSLESSSRKDKKYSKKRLLVTDSCSFALNTQGSKIPTRHSKSLDHLKIEKKNYSHHSLNDSVSSQTHQEKYTLFHRVNNEKTTRRETDQITMKERVYSVRSLNREKTCRCSTFRNHETKTDKGRIGYSTSLQNSVNMLAKESRNTNGNEKDKNELFKSLTEQRDKKSFQKLVKSLSETSNTNIQNLPRSNSVQYFSSEKFITDEAKKLNPMVDKTSDNTIIRSSSTKRISSASTPTNKPHRQREIKYTKHKSKSKNETNLSSSSSVESLPCFKKTNGWNSGLPEKIGENQFTQTIYNLYLINYYEHHFPFSIKEENQWKSILHKKI